MAVVVQAQAGTVVVEVEVEAVAITKAVDIKVADKAGRMAAAPGAACGAAGTIRTGRTVLLSAARPRREVRLPWVKMVCRCRRASIQTPRP